MRTYSVVDWCELHGFSLSYFYKLVAQGEAPRNFKTGRCRRISEEANREWIAAREAIAS